MSFVDVLRDKAAESVLNRSVIYFLATLLLALLASVLVAVFHLPQTPPYLVGLTMLFLIGFFYMVDPENEYTSEDFIALLLTSLFIVLFMALAGYASHLSLIKQYAAPLVYMQSVSSAAASAMQVPSTDLLGLALMNIWTWMGGLSIAMGIKVLITQRTQ